MKKLSETEKFGAVSGRRTITVEASKDELQKLRNALAVIAKVEKVADVYKCKADWTMVRNYHFDKDRFTVDVDQGMCG